VISDVLLTDTKVEITSFGQDAVGELYVTGFEAVSIGSWMRLNDAISRRVRTAWTT
jgi:hypothetical protein